MNADRIEHFRERLQQLAGEINADLAANKDDAGIVELDTSIGRLSRMDAMRQQAMEDETGRRRDKELHRIASALDRLESEDFGYCTACDEPIAFKRLENDPATPLCISCAHKASLIGLPQK